MKRKNPPRRTVPLQPKDYKAYMRSKDWQAKKKYFWARHKGVKGRCQGCKKPYKKGYHLHHRTYVRLGMEKMVDLVPLCPGCHLLLHFFQTEMGFTVEEATTQWLGRRNNAESISRTK